MSEQHTAISDALATQILAAVNGVNASVLVMGGKVDAMSSRMDRHDGRSEGRANDASKIEALIEKIDEKVTKLEDRVGKNEVALANLLGKVAGVTAIAVLAVEGAIALFKH